MNATVTANFDESAHSEAAYCFEQTSDAELLTNTRRLVGRSNQVLAALLAHLAEVEARGIHRLRACPSLYAYCVYELRFSEDAAFRRARAARVARRFPAIFRQVADGELHLTAIVLLAPHLTEENHREVLALAKHRTKREVMRIVRKLSPQPAVSDRIEPIEPEIVGIPVPNAPSWRELLESFAAGGRDLAPGDSPKDWVDRASAGPELAIDTAPFGDAAPVVGDPDMIAAPGVDAALVVDSAAVGPHGETDASSERYRVQFTASQEYADLLERAQDLLSHAVPNRSLEEVHLRALRLLVEQLEKRKYGAPRWKPSAETSVPAAGAAVATSAGPVPAQQSKNRAQLPRRRGAASVRREVRDRDGLQCAFVDEFGTRCRETRFLELHHELAHARGGGETARNLTMRCQAHNALAAEQDFGRGFMLERMSRRGRKER